MCFRNPIAVSFQNEGDLFVTQVSYHSFTFQKVKKGSELSTTIRFNRHYSSFNFSNSYQIKMKLPIFSGSLRSKLSFYNNYEERTIDCTIGYFLEHITFESNIDEKQKGYLSDDDVLKIYFNANMFIINLAKFIRKELKQDPEISFIQCLENYYRHISFDILLPQKFEIL